MATNAIDASSCKNSEVESPLIPDEESFVTQDKDKPKQVVAFNFIKLNPGLSKLNFYCCMVHHIIMVLSVSLPGALQTLILLSPEYYNVPKEQAGKMNSICLIIQLVVKLIVSIPYGYLVDKVGRKPMIYYAVISLTAGCLLMPTQKSIFPGFMIAQILMTNAGCALFTVPLSADYIADESKGKASAFLFMFIGFGGLGGNLISKALFYLQVSLGQCYVITGITLFSLFFLNTFGLKSNYKHQMTAAQVKESDQQTVFQKMKLAISIFRSNSWLMILLVVQVLGSSDFQVFFSLFTVYLKSLFSPDVDEQTQNIVVSNIQTLLSVPMILANVGYGYFLDKKNMIIKILIFALLGGSISFLLIAASKDPYIWSINAGAILLGTTLPGLYIVTGYLGIRHYPPDKRGIMTGFSGIIGSIGYFVLATSSGVLYDSWRKDGPFLICASLLVFAIILVLIIYKGMKNK